MSRVAVFASASKRASAASRRGSRSRIRSRMPGEGERLPTTIALFGERPLRKEKAVTRRAEAHGAFRKVLGTPLQDFRATLRYLGAAPRTFGMTLKWFGATLKTSERL